MQEYNSTDQRIHLLCQIIAKVNRTYVPSVEDDSHTNLYYDSVNDRIFGRWMQTNQGSVVITLNLEKQEFEWINDRFECVGNHRITGKTLNEIEADVEELLLAKGQPVIGLRNDLHFEIADYKFKDDTFKPFNKVGLSEWKLYRRLANQASASVLGMLQTRGEIRIWPHHFDTGLYVEPNQSLGIGYGLATYDGLVDSAYFYASGYSLKNRSIDYTNLAPPSFGKWYISEQWNGAVLEINSLQGLSFVEKLNMVESFSQTALNQLLSIKNIY